MRLDAMAREVHFVDHVAPVLLALPEEMRGDLIVERASLGQESPTARAARYGIEAVTRPTDRSRPVLVSSYGDNKAAWAAGRRAIARMEHGIGQSFLGSDDPSYAGGRGADGVGLFLCPNEHSASRWRGAYPRTRVEVVGCPKLDSLPRREGPPGRVVAVSFHWSQALTRHGALVETGGSFDEYRAAVAHLALHYRVLGHGHPRAQSRLAAPYRIARIPLVRDFADVCRQADVYVCDTNSTIYEFASTGRPVVVVNGSHFRRDVEHGLRFWEAAGVGVQCDHPSELAAAVEEALEDAPAQRKAREQALDLVYAHRGDAARRAADAIADWLGEARAQVAA